MRAIAYLRYGGPEVTEIVTASDPVAGPREILVRVIGAGLNPVDAAQRAGAFRAIHRYVFPKVAGNEVSGIVEHVGVDTARFRPGDAVFARLDKQRLGGLADRVVIDEELAALAPKGMPLLDAAGLPLAGLTALQGLGEGLLDVQPGARLLITGGAGGVGLMAIQLAKLRGAHVTTTASSAGEALVKWAGADAVIDYRERPVSEWDERFDAVFDLVGGDALPELFSHVSPGGAVVSVAGPLTPGSLEVTGNALKRFVIFVALTVASAGVRRRARRSGVSYRFFFMRPDGEGLTHLAELIDRGDLQMAVDGRFSFQDYRQAFERLESRRAKGKVIVEVSR